MTGVDDDTDVRAAAQLVGRINWWIRATVEACADCGGEMSAGRKADHANLACVDMPLRGVLAHEAQCALRVLHCRLHLRVKATSVLHSRAGIRHAVFEQDAGDAARR